MRSRRTPAALLLTSALLYAGQIPGANAAPRWTVPASEPASPPGTQPAGPNDEVNVLLVASPSPHTQPPAPARLYLGGNFTAIDGAPPGASSAHLAAWNGSSWQPGPGLANEVLDLQMHHVHGTPTLFAAGFSDLVPNPDAFSHVSLAYLENGAWKGVTLPGAGYIFGLESFSLAGDAQPRLALSSPLFHPFSYIAELGPLNTSGPFATAPYIAMGSGVITVTNAFCAFDAGNGPRLYCGVGSDSAQTLGFFSGFDGTDWTNTVGGPTMTVHAIVPFDDGSGPALFVAGSFNHINTNMACSRIAKFQNGVFTPLARGLDRDVYSLCIHDDGTGPALYAGGLFTQAPNAIGPATPVNRVAKWKDGQWHALDGGLGTGTNTAGGVVKSLASFDDDGEGPMPAALYAAGTFVVANGQPAKRFARWGETLCAADLDNGSSTGTRDLAVDINDLLYFLVLFEAGNVAVDLDNDGDPAHSTPDGGVDINDLLFFLARFESGC